MEPFLPLRPFTSNVSSSGLWLTEYLVPLLWQYNFILVVGASEEEHNTANVRTRDGATHGTSSKCCSCGCACVPVCLCVLVCVCLCACEPSTKFIYAFCAQICALTAPQYCASQSAAAL